MHLLVSSVTSGLISSCSHPSIPCGLSSCCCCVNCRSSLVPASRLCRLSRSFAMNSGCSGCPSSSMTSMSSASRLTRAVWVISCRLFTWHSVPTSAYVAVMLSACLTSACASSISSTFSHVHNAPRAMFASSHRCACAMCSWA